MSASSYKQIVWPSRISPACRRWAPATGVAVQASDEDRLVILEASLTCKTLGNAGCLADSGRSIADERGPLRKKAPEKGNPCQRDFRQRLKSTAACSYEESCDTPQCWEAPMLIRKRGCDSDRSLKLFVTINDLLQ